MEDNNYDAGTLAALESFHRVWDRVNGLSPALHAVQPLTEYISRLCLLHRHYTALSMQFAGGDRMTLQGMAGETSLHGRQLMAELYIREGRLWTPETKPLLRGKCPLLRAAILLEDELTALCAKTRDGAPYKEIAAASAVRREKAKKLLIATI